MNKEWQGLTCTDKAGVAAKKVAQVHDVGGLVDGEVVVQKSYDDSAFSWKCKNGIWKQMLQGKIWGVTMHRLLQASGPYPTIA